MESTFSIIAEPSRRAILSLLAMGPLALRFRHALKVAGFALRAAQSLRINSLSAFYHFFVPLSIGAELTKFVQLKMTHPERGALAGPQVRQLFGCRPGRPTVRRRTREDGIARHAA